MLITDALIPTTLYKHEPSYSNFEKTRKKQHKGLHKHWCGMRLIRYQALIFYTQFHNISHYESFVFYVCVCLLYKKLLSFMRNNDLRAFSTNFDKISTAHTCLATRIINKQT